MNAAIFAADTCKFLARICLTKLFEGLKQNEEADRNVLLAEFVKICNKIYSSLAANCY